jgi:amidase
MNRRKFISTSAFSSVAVPTIFAVSCQSPENRERNSQVDLNSFSLNEITINQLQQQMAEGKITSESITNLYIKRIKEIDQNGPKLNSVIELNPDALAIASALDAERRNGKIRGLMHGIPVLLKDNIETGDKMPTTAGSLALEGHIAKKDAFIVNQLRKAGAVILGKTNLSEWANFRSTRSSSGWSAKGGQTRNPYQLDRSPCGSSSGSAVAVSANLCSVAVGTETNGSIACPASTNGVVGIKPTVGLLSRSGIVPISKTQDTAGPLARTVTDAVILLEALAGIDSSDPITTESKNISNSGFTKFLKIDGLSNKRIGVEKSFLKFHEWVDVLMSAALETMKKNGATIVEVELIKEFKGIEDGEFELLLYEFKDGINKFLKSSGTGIDNLNTLIAYNNKNTYREMRYFKQEIFEQASTKKGLESKEYKDLYQNVTVKSREIINRILSVNKLDAICGPANGPSWCIDLINGDAFSGYGTYSPAAIAGYPAITVPMGLVHELPVGLTFLGKKYSEPQLIEIAFAYEQLSHKRMAPWFSKTISL